MSKLRDEAQDTTTAPGRLAELTRLPGDRGGHDSDSGWCREFVAANPSAPPEILAELAADMNDVMARFGAAKNPNTPAAAVHSLVDDPNDMVANAARERLGLDLRPRPGIHIPGLPAHFRRNR